MPSGFIDAIMSRRRRGSHGTSSGAAAVVREQQLFDFDQRKPVTQTFPTTVAGWTAFGATDPTHIFTYDQSSGNETDHIDGTTQLIPQAAPIQGQTATGLWDGSGMNNRGAVEFTDGDTASMAYDNTNTGRLDESMSALIVFRATLVSASRIVMGRRDGSAPNLGWELTLQNPSGNLQLVVDSSAGSASFSIIQNFADGAWHYALVTIDVAGNFYLDTDLGSNSGVFSGDPDVAGLTMHIGQDRATTCRSQHVYHVLWEGANANRATLSSAVSSWWVLGDDPTGLLTTNTRASLVTSITDNDGSFGDYLTRWHGSASVVQLPHAYRANLVDSIYNAAGIGLQVEDGRENFATLTEDIASWTASSATLNANVIDAPDGFRAMDEIVQTGAGGHAHRTFSGLTAETTYVLSLWLQTADSHNVEVRVTDGATGTVQRATDTFATTTKRVRYSQTVTTAAGETSLRVEIYGGTQATSNQTARAWGVQLEEDLWATSSLPSSYIPNSATASSATAAGIDMRSTLIADAMGDGSGAQNPAGELNLSLVMDAIRAGNQEVLNISGVSRARINFGTNLWLMFDDAGAGVASFVFATNPTAGARHTMRLRWNSAAGIRGGADTVDAQGLTAGFTSGSTSTWTPEQTTWTTAIFGVGAPSSNLRGVIERIQGFRRPRADTAN